MITKNKELRRTTPQKSGKQRAYRKKIVHPVLVGEETAESASSGSSPNKEQRTVGVAWIISHLRASKS
jgi:hypothetical protein